MEVAKIKITGTDATVSDLKKITSGMIGATVSIEYDDTWEGLNRQVVFSGPLGAVNADGSTIPHEVLRLSGHELKVGVYGYTDDGSRAIPTIWASLGMIQPGADPEGDETAAPTLPVWARMQNQIGNLDDLQTKARESLVAAINELASMGLNQEQIYTIIEQTLTQAKESGEFDGAPGPVGPPGPQGEPGPQGPQGESAVVDEAEIKQIMNDNCPAYLKFPAVTTADAGKKLSFVVNDNGEWVQELGVDKIPVFDLTAMGLPDIPLDGTHVTVECDAAQITAALNKGLVRFTYTVAGMPAFLMGSIVYLNGMYQIATTGYLYGDIYNNGVYIVGNTIGAFVQRITST